MHRLLILIGLFLSFNSYAGLCIQKLDDIPVLSQGRVKPFYVMANETLKLISDQSTFENKSAVEVICLLTLESIKMKSDINLTVKIDHVKIQDLFNFADNQHFISIKEALASKDLIKSEILKETRTTSYKKALNKLWFKLTTYEDLVAGTFWKVVDPDINVRDLKWISINEPFQHRNAQQMFLYLSASREKYKKLEDDTYLLELTLSKSHLFSIAMLTALLGIFLTVLVKKPLYGTLFAWLTIALEMTAMAMRVIISGRAPITNMYETVLFSGFGALLIALIVVIFKKDKIFILGGLGYNILCLFMLKFAHGMLDSTISPLVPVLRDNFWLSTHVTTIMLSYAALALSWLLANITLGKQRIKGFSTKDYKYYEDMTYTAIKIGVVLLAAGIILGGVWADYSWGRFWGWDPKETWSLIVLLFYMAVLHGKSTSWINTHRFIILSAAGFMTVMMAWFGVNYILATGLHSYGFSEGGAIFLGSFFTIQILYLILTAKRKIKT